jgi:nitrate reductase NapE component
VQGGGTQAPRPGKGRGRSPERRFATDYFMFFVYALLAVAMLAQVALIVWLDII